MRNESLSGSSLHLFRKAMLRRVYSQEPHFCIIRRNLHARCGSIPADFLVSYPQPPLSGASQMKLNPITDNIMNRIHQKMSLEQKIQTLKEDFLELVKLLIDR